MNMNTNPQIPIIEAGILFSPLIRFRLNGIFRAGTQDYPSGDYALRKQEDRYILETPENTVTINLPFTLLPREPETADFDLTDVVIGIHFHWERKENQKFKGGLKLIDEGEHLTAVNLIPLEDYLLSVISSEMSATSSPELLKAHAVISRSWLLAQREKAGTLAPGYRSVHRSDEEYLRWYDREDHAHFDVCADDHCQRYQGISKACTPAVREALQATAGEVIMYANRICDARFSKCCGGATERFENTWEPVHHPYLEKITDTPEPVDTGDLSREEDARKWILSSPPAFCNTTDTAILSEVLNDYDLATRHFYRWQVEYPVARLSALVKEKLEIDFGTVTDILPVERGASGRLIRVKICGTRKTRIIGKELLIRKAFSESHLYSSAFIVEKKDDRFLFRGAGWGHGVGLCQIGAAVMAARGYGYKEILRHYFKDCEIVKIY